MSAVVFKKATLPLEFDQIHRLNHRTFAEEIRQHLPTTDGALVDPLHVRNTYFIASRCGQLLGMIAVHDQPPFSVTKRLVNPEILIDLGRSPLEARLLAIEPHARHRTILAGLFWQVYSHARANGHSHILISGVADRAEMYHALGFEDLGQPVKDGSASFIPMVLRLENASGIFTKRALRFEKWWSRAQAVEQVNLLPGPVEISPSIRKAFAHTPISHRGSDFLEVYALTRSCLSSLASGTNTAIVTGSGSLANDIVAANLKASFGQAPGLVLTNGEFGERLIRHAKGAGLAFDTLAWPWGQPWSFDQIAGWLSRQLSSTPAWIWAVHLETSTGVLNDLAQLGELAGYYGAHLAADCVSSLGAVPVHARELFLASGVSGKAIGAYAGLAFVFASDLALQRVTGGNLPPVFDIRQAIQSTEPPFTIPSPQMLALNAALELHYSESRRSARFDHYHRLCQWLRQKLENCGILPLASEACAAPTIVTFRLPSARFVEECRIKGFNIAYESGYLRCRAWGQISIMGDLTQQKLEPLFAKMETITAYAETSRSRPSLLSVPDARTTPALQERLSWCDRG